MVDNLHPDSGSPDRARRPEPTAPDMRSEDLTAEREIAFDSAGRPVPAVHAWLDGEGTEAEARRADARDTALWSQIEDEAARRRRMTTPAPVLERLVASIPTTQAGLAAVPAPENDDSVMSKIKKIFGK